MTPAESLRYQLQTFIQFRRNMKLSPGSLRFISIEDLVLQHGTEFRRSLKPPPVRPVPQACFSQSYRLATRKRSKWIYCEGYAINRIGLALNHAWITLPDTPDEAYEVAWETTEDTAYIGIPFQTDFVRDTHRSSRRPWVQGPMYGVLDAWWIRHPLITGATAIETAMWKP